MDNTLHRRELLKTASVVALGASLGGCVRTSSASRPFAKVRVSPDRVIRTTIGLRPFRSSGFLVRGERFDDKTVIHNYGHGSNGVSMSWGAPRAYPRFHDKTASCSARPGSAANRHSSRARPRWSE